MTSRTFRDPDGSNQVGLIVEVPSLEALQEALQSEGAEEAMKHDGVRPETMLMLVEARPRRANARGGRAGACAPAGNASRFRKPPRRHAARRAGARRTRSRPPRPAPPARAAAGPSDPSRRSRRVAGCRYRREPGRSAARPPRQPLARGRRTLRPPRSRPPRRAAQASAARSAIPIVRIGAPSGHLLIHTRGPPRPTGARPPSSLPRTWKARLTTRRRARARAPTSRSRPSP